MNIIKKITVLGLAFGLASCEETPAPTLGDYAIQNVTIIPMDTNTLIANQTVVIEGDSIKAIGQAGSFNFSEATKIIDGTGKFLTPGLADMHVHIWSPLEPPLYIANGVTMVRNMWGEGMTNKIMDGIKSGEILGPTMISGGRIIDGAPRIWEGSDEVTTPEEAKEVVRAQKEAGWDFIKVYSNLSLEAFDAIAEEAKALDIPFAGHVPSALPLEHAMRSGMATIEHLTRFKESTVKDGIDMGQGFLSPERIELGTKIHKGELGIGDIFDPKKTATLANLAKETGIWNVPTLVVLNKIYLTREQAKAEYARDEIKYIGPAITSFWNPDNDFRRQNTTEEAYLAMQAFFEGEKMSLKALHDAGANILAGTDAPNPYVFHGFSIYEELQFMVDAGLTPYEAIKTSTINPALFLNQAGEFGTIKVGARADLILLGKNPLETIDNFQAREGVMVRGEWHSQSDLNAVLSKVAEGVLTAPTTLDLEGNN